MAEPAITLVGVTKAYKLYASPQDRLKEALHPFKKTYHRTFNALNKLDLTVNKGEILGIVGRNGSGKSTLLKLISRVLVPTKGSVETQGKLAALLELGAGFNPEFTGAQNIGFYATILGLSDEEIAQRREAIIEFADIGEHLHQPIKTYSSGMRSRLAFAVAAHVDPDILILDEVLAVGDVQFRRKCYAVMERLFKSGKTIIYVSHDTNSINQLCSRVVFLDRGRLLMDGEPKLVTAYYQKYILAKEENAAAVLEEIEQIGRESEGAAGAAAAATATKATQAPKSRYVETLQSQTRMEYKNADVTILDEAICDADGNRVNVLHYGESYTFQVRVAFGEAATDVAFGLEFKDIKGVVVTSVESALLYKLDRAIETVRPGQVFLIRYKFDCRFSANTYLMNFGVSSFAAGQEVLSRIVDVYMFKVEQAEQYSYGMAQLVESMSIESESGSESGKSSRQLIRDYS